MSITVIVIICIILASGFAYANYHKDLSVADTPKNIMTAEQQRYLDKVVERTAKVWNELKQEYNVDEIKYFQLEISKLSEFQQGEGYLEDKELTRRLVAEVIQPNISELPVGAVRPLILIAKDGNEVLFLYKEADGTDVLKRSTFMNSKWEKDNEQRKPGEKIEAISK